MPEIGIRFTSGTLFGDPISAGQQLSSHLSFLIISVNFVAGIAMSVQICLVLPVMCSWPRGINLMNDAVYNSVYTHRHLKPKPLVNIMIMARILWKRIFNLLL